MATVLCQCMYVLAQLLMSNLLLELQQTCGCHAELFLQQQVQLPLMQVLLRVQLHEQCWGHELHVHV